jgi:hypothetical protein
MTKTAHLLKATKGIVSRNWQPKLVALLLAFLFWYAVKSEIGTDREQRSIRALQDASLNGAARY